MRAPGPEQPNRAAPRPGAVFPSPGPAAARGGEEGGNRRRGARAPPGAGGGSWGGTGFSPGEGVCGGVRATGAGLLHPPAPSPSCRRAPP